MIPTGGGKTFVAVHFLCRKPLSEGYKVLWLAHTHHLLDQAFYSFGPRAEQEGTGYEVASISPDKSELRIRVVSGFNEHFRLRHVEFADDVLMCTLQTASRGYKQRNPQLLDFLKASQGKLVVVFDEAHHAPAPSYRRLMMDLRNCHPELYALGLTATPTYTDEKKRGWLDEVFPDGHIYEVAPQQLMADEILAKPRIEQHRTNIDGGLDEKAYRSMVNSNRDIPEKIISRLAENQARNQYIVQMYVENQDRYDKTLVFADRKRQCKALKKLFRQQGIKVDTMYSGKSDDENARALEAFRNDEIDVLVNIRMLTEGTDVPSAKTAFLTRQTTSSILITQMVGRVLRGPRFGGAEEANIVAFIDNWEHLIHWAGFGPWQGFELPPEAEEDRDLKAAYSRHPPVESISFDLIQRLREQIDRGININPGPFITLMPCGWYHVEFLTVVGDEEDETEPVSHLLMVFDNERTSYARFIEHLETAPLDVWAEETLRFDGQQQPLKAWWEQFFANNGTKMSDYLMRNLFDIARHVAQNETTPTFFEFEEREAHDLDVLAYQFIEENYGSREVDQRLYDEYQREDRYWKVLYPTYDLFKSQYNACVEWILKRDKDEEDWRKLYKSLPYYEEPVPTKTREQIFERDHHRCLCCGSTLHLQIDHIKPRYTGVDNSYDNLQTLCRTCNTMKSAETMDFREQCTPLADKPHQLDLRKLKRSDDVNDVVQWQQALRRVVNFFYQCAAVDTLEVDVHTGPSLDWSMRLHEGNDQAWIAAYLPELKEEIARLANMAVKVPFETAMSAASPEIQQPESTRGIYDDDEHESQIGAEKTKKKAKKAKKSRMDRRTASLFAIQVYWTATHVINAALDTNIWCTWAPKTDHGREDLPSWMREIIHADDSTPCWLKASEILDGIMNLSDAERLGFMKDRVSEKMPVLVEWLLEQGRADAEGVDIEAVQQTAVEVMGMTKSELRIMARDMEIQVYKSWDSRRILSEIGASFRPDVSAAKASPQIASPQDTSSPEDTKPSMVILTRRGFMQRHYAVQRVPLDGAQPLAMRDTQQVAECAVMAQPSDTVLFFTSGGLMYTATVQDIPLTNDLSAPGTPLELSIPPARFVAAVDVPAFDHSMDLLMLTREGRVKRTVLSEFDSGRSNGLKALSLKPGDKLGWVQRIHSDQHTHGQHILVVSRQGKAIRFKAREINQVSRTAFGVGAIKLRAGDLVGGMDAFTPARALVMLLITEQGYVNSIPLWQFKVQGRYGTGSYSFSRSMKRCGEIVAAHVASGQETLTMFSKDGEVLRIPVPEIPRESANSQGTELMPLREADSIVLTTISKS